MSTIYKITSPSNSVYIGQSWWVKERFSKYRNLKCKGQRHLYNSLKKYGPENHKFEIVHELHTDVDQDTVDRFEIAYWEFYKEAGFDMLNLMYPGGGMRMPKSVRDKIAETKRLKPYKHTEATKKLLAERSRGNKNQLGKKKSPEALLKMSISRMGIPHSEATRQKMRQKKSESHRVAMFTAKQDKTIYKFVNTVTGDKYEGIRDTFKKMYNLDGPSVGRVIKGQIRHTKNWVIVR